MVLPALAALLSQAALGQNPDHFVVGQGPPGGPPLKLFSAAWLEGASGHGPSINPAQVLPIIRINPLSSYSNPRFGGYSFSTSGFSGIGFDYAIAPHDLALGYLNPPPANFTVNTLRLGYSRPTEFAVYSPTGAPRMVEDGDAYQIGDAFDGGHVHPLFLARRPGQTAWTLQYTSDAWLASDSYTYTFTTVPGRGALVPLNMTSIFNADVVDSDPADAPTPFDAAGNMWVLNGHHGTNAGLPVDGQLAGFQLGGPGAAGLAGSAQNVLLDRGALSMAATLDLVATGQADRFLSIEFLVGGAGAFTSADIATATLTYADNTTRSIQIRQGSTSYLPFRPLDDWLQSAALQPWTAIGAAGDRSAGFVRSTGSAIDGAAGANFFFFRACSAIDSTRVLNRITFADYTGTNTIGVFAILAIKKAPLAITTATLPAARQGLAYSAPVLAAGTPPYKNWAATGLPSGLSIDAATGVISGTPAAGTAGASPHSVTIHCNDSINDFDATYPLELATANLTLNVLPRPGDIDDDGDVDAADQALFTAVLLGLQNSPLYVQRSDLNDDGRANGADVQEFVDARLGV